MIAVEIADHAVHQPHVGVHVPDHLLAGGGEGEKLHRPKTSPRGQAVTPVAAVFFTRAPSGP